MSEKIDIACPIWGTPATVVAEDYGRHKSYTSPRAGGTFVVTFPWDDWASKLSLADKAQLTTWIVEQNRVGAVPEISSKRLREIETVARLAPPRRADRLIEFISSREQHLGDFVRIVYDKRISDEVTMEALAWAGCTNIKELIFLLSSLRNSGLVDGRVTLGGEDAALTLAGYARLTELSAVNQDACQAFIAMWFHNETHEAYEDGIEPAMRTSGYRPLRIDRKETIGKIDDEIVAEIRRSRFVVADFTSEPEKPRGGVYFEAGFAMGLNIPVIWTCRGDLIDQVHFDTRQFSHITWSDPGDLRTKLINRIGAVIGPGPLVGA